MEYHLYSAPSFITHLNTQSEMIKESPRASAEETEFSHSHFQAIAQSVVHAFLLFFTVKCKFSALTFFLGEAMWHSGKIWILLLALSQRRFVTLNNLVHFSDSVSPS